jgi:hypothetical protein
MGRSVLILVLLMTTIYVGIMISLQRKMLDLPDIITQNMLLKQAESVSDYALRTAVRNSVPLGMQASPEVVWTWVTRYNNFNIQNCVIDSIRYDFAYDSSRYRARTYVRGNLMGNHVDYNAEIAFEFPLINIVGNPNIFYIECDQPQFNPSAHWDYAWDSTDYHNDGLPYPLGNISTRPNGQGANGWKCASFEEDGGYIYNLGHPSMQVSTNFTLVSFAKIRSSQTYATDVWMASDPYDGTTAYTGTDGVYHPGKNLRLKPSCGIYYENGYLYFTAVNNIYNQITVSTPFIPAGKWPHNKDSWVFMGMTYNRGIVKGYVNGALVGTNATGFPFAAIPPSYGYSIGRRDLRGGTFAWADYKYMFGLLDQIGLYDRTLTDAEMAGFYNQVINPANIQYIKD